MSTSSFNYYNVLGVNQNATLDEIKKARNRLARAYHPDKYSGNDSPEVVKERMGRINKAFATLSNTQLRDHYDQVYDSTEVNVPTVIAGELTGGSRLSDELKAKIQSWIGAGVPKTDVCSSFRNLNCATDAATVISEGTSPETQYHNLLSRNVSSIDQILASILPKSIYNWTLPKLPTISVERLNSEAWIQEISTLAPTSLSYQTDYRAETDLIVAFLQRPMSDKRVRYANIVNITSQLLSFYAEQNYTFPSKQRHRIGSKIPLAPLNLSSELGYIPHHTVPAAPAPLDKYRAICTDCINLFSTSRWEYECAVCTKSFCSDCMQFRKVLDFVKNMRVCNCCAPKIQHYYKAEWTTPLDQISVRKQITSAYLTLLDEQGYANKQQFLIWVEKFLADGRIDLALQCNLSANGSWWVLAEKLARQSNYTAMDICINMVADSIGNLTEEERKNKWISFGNEYAERINKLGTLLSVRKILMMIAFTCYAKAGFKAEDYRDLSRKEIDTLFGKCCFLMYLKMSKKDGTKFIDDEFQSALSKNEHALAVFCLVLQNEREKCSTIINSLPVQIAEPFVQVMVNRFGFRGREIHLNPDRTHLRWHFLSPPKFDVWLDYLIDSLQRADGKNSIAYFRLHMQNENFIAHRDRFLAEGNYTKAFVCHRLAPNSLSWRELARKWQQNHEAASVMCCFYAGDDLNVLGDQALKDEKYTLALLCYGLAGKSTKIVEVARTLPTEARLLYLKNSLGSPVKFDVVMQLCEALLAEQEEAATAAVRKILIACIKLAKPAESLRFHKLFLATKLSDAEVWGLVSTVAPLCVQPADKKWHRELVASIKAKFVANFRAQILSGSFEELPTLLNRCDPLMWPAINDLVAELNIPNMGNGQIKSVALLVRAITRWLNPSGPQLFPMMNDISDAMLGHPKEECILFCTKFIEKISLQNKHSKPLRGHFMTEVQHPSESQHLDRLQSTVDTRILTRSEKNLAKLPPFVAAMSRIDLCNGIGSGAGILGAFLTAAADLLRAQQELQPAQTREKYAYRRAIFELVMNARAISHGRMSPATQLYVLRSSIALLTQAFDGFGYISEDEDMYLEEMYQDLDRLTKIVPLVMPQILQLYDTVYFDLINRDFMEKYLTLRRDNPQNAKNPVYQYFILEGTRRHWLSPESFDFDVERGRTMEALLISRGNRMQDVENLMHWPSLQRDQEGWLASKAAPLNIEVQGFSHVEGIRFNMKTGEISFMLQSSPNPQENVMDMTDIADILNLGVTNAFFTLDPPDPEMPQHPFQNMVYGPGCLEGSNYLGTMLHADILLKMLTMGVEVSGNAPFKLRDADENLLKRLPERLRKKFKDLRNESTSTSERVHRFWIQAGDLEYFTNEQDNEVTFTFGKCEMSVQKHLMQRDHNGNLVDTDNDNDTTSTEAKFAKLLTDEYVALGKYFPELAKLRELAKIQTMSLFAQSIYRSAIQNSEKLSVSRTNIEQSLNELFKGVRYPQNTSTNVNSLVDKVLRQSNVTRSSIPHYELNQLEKKIARDCADADDQCLKHFVNTLSESFHCTSNITSLVSNWLTNGVNFNLATHLKHSQEAHEKAKILRICETFQRMRIAFECNARNAANRCTWVPAAFGERLHHQIYGGVNMNPNLVAGGPGGGPNSNAGNMGPGPGGANARYIVRMEANGRIYGTSIAVDPVTGNTYKVLEMNKTVTDQYNQHLTRLTNTTTTWKARYGGDVDHYTTHKVGSAHVHSTSGQATCFGPKTKQDFTSGDKSHRCK